MPLSAPELCMLTEENPVEGPLDPGPKRRDGENLNGLKAPGGANVFGIGKPPGVGGKGGSGVGSGWEAGCPSGDGPPTGGIIGGSEKMSPWGGGPPGGPGGAIGPVGMGSGSWSLGLIWASLVAITHTTSKSTLADAVLHDTEKTVEVQVTVGPRLTSQ